MTPIPSKIEGIVTPEIIKIVSDRLIDNEQKEMDKEFLMCLEPHFVNEMVKQSENAMRLFEQKGVKADVKKMIGDLVITAYMRSALVYMQAVRQYDIKKLDAMYNVDFEKVKEEIENRLIDEELKKRAKKAPEVKKTKLLPSDFLGE